MVFRRGSKQELTLAERHAAANAQGEAVRSIFVDLRDDLHIAALNHEAVTAEATAQMQDLAQLAAASTAQSAQYRSLQGKLTDLLGE